MNISAIGVTSKDLKKTVKFYETLGFVFPEFKEDEDHIESTSSKNGLRLMIDDYKIVEEIIGEKPKASNHSVFAIEADSPKDVDNMVDKLRENNYIIKKEPWDAFWGQRYAVVQDPDGYLIDIFKNL